MLRATSRLLQGGHLVVRNSSSFRTTPSQSFLRCSQPVHKSPFRVFSTEGAPHPSEAFINGTNANALEELYTQWQEDPRSVDSAFSDFFGNLDKDVPPGRRVDAPVRQSRFSGVSESGSVDIQKSFGVFSLIRSYRVLGHFLANLDPLNLEQAKFSKVKEEYKRELDPQTFGFTDADMDKEFFVGSEFPGNTTVLPLREIISTLKSIYCGNVGAQFMHVHDPSIKQWVRQEMDKLYSQKMEKKDQHHIYEQLLQAELFEEFCEKKFQNTKRFGLNGGESLIPGMDAMVRRAADYGIENIVIGMPHRGRLNVMANILEKPLTELFSEFKMEPGLSDSVQGSGDVKYHLGTSRDRTIGDKTIHLSLAANPSHLEAVNPVVCGKTRAKQTDPKGNQDFNKALSVLIHGDAAFAGQGVVAETIELSGLGDFTTGGTIHIVVNNQIGFTTVPKYSRTSPYPSEVAKATGSPIFHVNGDDPEAVASVFKIAVDYRQKFHTDTVIDIYCYRRFGHNELDEPRFTQPKMYQKIEKHRSAAKIYGEKLATSNALTEPEQLTLQKKILDNFQKYYDKRTEYSTATGDWLECHWKGFVNSMSSQGEFYPTGVSKENIKRVMNALVTLPEGFRLHPKLKTFRFLPFQKMIDSEKGFNWAMGEALAFGTLLLEKFEVRLSGQDCERGTFSHRHAVLYCQETENTYESLEHLDPDQGFFNVINSSLSENAVLGFEHGYSLEHPNCLALWEAQFGDFVNGGQVIIDQFISSGEQKWLRMSGLTMLLPHGFEGQGPEHSSCRPERFLQLCDDNPYVFQEDPSHAALNINLQVANCTTPANFFHLLRRQLHRNFRKPLVVMTPKSLLKSQNCVSDIEEFGPSSEFKRLYADQCETLVEGSKVRKLIICTGKVYYDLAQERATLAESSKTAPDVAIVRVEQIAPFPYDLLKAEKSKYPNAKVLWVQEEPLNQGAWTYVAPRIETALDGIRPTYVGRLPSAAPATGLTIRHNRELQKFLSEAFE